MDSAARASSNAEKNFISYLDVKMGIEAGRVYGQEAERVKIQPRPLLDSAQFEFQKGNDFVAIDIDPRLLTKSVMTARQRCLRVFDLVLIEQ